MRRQSKAVPKYCQHRASGQAVVTLNGRDHYLGPYGTRASKVNYDRVIGEWLVSGRQPLLSESEGRHDGAQSRANLEIVRHTILQRRQHTLPAAPPGSHPQRAGRHGSCANMIQIVSREMLEELAAEIPGKPAKPASNGQSNGNCQPYDLAAFMQRNSFEANGPHPWEGGQKWTFNHSPMCEHHGDGPYVAQHGSGALMAGCHHDSCYWDWKALRAKFEPKGVGMPDLRPAEYRADPVYDSKSVTAEPRYRIFTAAELDAAVYAQDYHIDDILVVGDFAMLGGPEKSLKTSLLVDMLITLNFGGQFLGAFPVRRPCRTLLFSGESGLPNLQDIARRVCRRYGYSLGEAENFALSPDLPQLDNAVDLAEFERVIDQHEPDVVGLDPMFLCLGDTDADAGNMFVMGKLLRKFYAICQERGITPIIAHHTLTMQLGTIPKLSNLAWSGFKQAAGQWILLNRRAEYEPGTSEHQLLMVTGGRAGHNLMRAIDVREGTRKSFEGRYWLVDVHRIEDVRNAGEQRKAEAKAAEANQRLEGDRRAIIKTVTGMNGRAGTKTDIRDRTGMRSDRFNVALASLLDDRHLEPVRVTKANNRHYDGFMLVEESNP